MILSNKLEAKYFLKNRAMKKPRVMIVLPSAQCGGAEKVFLNIANNLNKDQVGHCLLFIDETGPLLKEINADIPIISTNRKRVSQSFLQLIKLIRRYKPDVVMSTIIHLNIAVILTKLFINRKTKIMIRESSFTSIAHKNSKYKYILKIFIQLFYPFADIIIVLGEAMKRDLLDFIFVPKAKIISIPNPIDLNALKIKCNAYECPFNKDNINFVAAGNFSWAKGFDLLIEAMKIVVEKRPNAHLTILGQGKLKPLISRMIHYKKLSNFITLTGFLNNPYPYYHHADQFVLSSRYEGLPNVALEAIALGTPVIAFDTAGCIKDIIINPSMGTLLTSYSAEALGNAMLESSKKPCDQILPTLPAKFNIDNVIQRYHQLFFESIG